ncbi:MAG: hypothetical protein J3R72DRAFT_498741 [Linnemannia gamsii]|nr:MAG: hypothetical protein J3R72DRAFT_498741 [Linnemannia gamsii]
MNPEQRIQSRQRQRELQQSKHLNHVALARQDLTPEKTFCDNNYGGGVAVTPAHVLDYLNKEVFTGGTFKRILPGATFNGAVARWRKEVLDTNVDPGSAKKRRKKSQKKVVEAVETVDGEDDDSELDYSGLDDLMDVSENPASEFSTWSTLDQPKERPPECIHRRPRQKSFPNPSRLGDRTEGLDVSMDASEQSKDRVPYQPAKSSEGSFDSRGKQDKSDWQKAVRSRIPPQEHFACTVVAFALYMLERFHVDNEPFHDLMSPAGWHDIKLLSSSEVPLQTSALDLSTQIYCAKAVQTSYSVFCPKVTHAGRYGGCAEAYT